MSHHCARNWHKFNRESKLTNDKDLKSQLGQIHSCVSINLRRDVSPSFGPGICRSWITSSNCTDAVVYLPWGRKPNLNWDLELLLLLYISELFYRLLMFDYKIKRGKKSSSPKISFQMTARFCVYFIEIDLLYKSIYIDLYVIIYLLGLKLNFEHCNMELWILGNVFQDLTQTHNWILLWNFYF